VQGGGRREAEHDAATVCRCEPSTRFGSPAGFEAVEVGVRHMPVGGSHREDEGCQRGCLEHHVARPQDGAQPFACLTGMTRVQRREPGPQLREGAQAPGFGLAGRLARDAVGEDAVAAVERPAAEAEEAGDDVGQPAEGGERAMPGRLVREGAGEGRRESSVGIGAFGDGRSRVDDDSNPRIAQPVAA